MRMPGVSTYYGRQSETVRNYPRPWVPTPVTSEMITENFNFYKDDATISKIDAYVCTFPASMCEMWMAFKKAKIVYMAAHRYNLGRCSVGEWNLLDNNLRLISQDKANT